MNAIAQLDEFTAFAHAFAAKQRTVLTLEQVYDEWWQQKHRDEDLAAIRLAVTDYENGGRGRPAVDVLTDARNRLASSKG
jgi:hypothetical protein